MSTTIDPTQSPTPQTDPFPALQSAVLRTFEAITTQTDQLFRVQVDCDLFDLFLSKLPEEIRQHHNCNACRSFVRRYGALVRIDSQGNVLPAMWSEVLLDEGSPFWEAVRTLGRTVCNGRISEPFFTAETTWGHPVTDTWTHLYAQPDPKFLADTTAKTASQLAAEKVEEFKMLTRGLAEFPLPIVKTALSYLRNDKLQRGEKHVELAAWLVQVHEQTATVSPTARKNLLWKVAASAPAGWCHVKSGMIGTLLEDVQAGLPFDQVARKYNEKMHPLQYQRPTAPPKVGNIEQAEKLVEKLGVAKSLERRFAKLADLQILWQPKPSIAAPTKPGVFGALRPPKHTSPIVSDASAQVMTWEKFARTVLPTAERIDLLVGHGGQPFAAYVAAVHADAPKILQWDNPVSWYFKHPTSHAYQWNLRAGELVEVTALSLLPTMWQDPPLVHQGTGVMIVLKGARDVEHHGGGGFFVESLRSEYHGIRQTLEAHVRNSIIQGAEEAEACGICLKVGSPWGPGQTLRVTAGGVQTLYRLDRWD